MTFHIGPLTLNSMGQTTEYLVSYGSAGILGRFLAADGQVYARGERVLVQSERGQEIGSVVLPGKGESLALPFVPLPGQLLRRLTVEDESRLEQMAPQGQVAFNLAREIIAKQALPVELLDVEIIAEPLTFVLHHLRFGELDWRPVVHQLSTQLDAFVLLQDLTAPQEEGGCGSCGEGGCGDGGCGDGGCSTGGCGSGCGTGSAESFAADWNAYFAERRSEMERRRISLPL